MRSIPYVIKPLSRFDLDPIMAIEKMAFEVPWSKDAMQDALSAPSVQPWGLVSSETQALLGFILLSVVRDEAEIWSMAIHTTHHRQGLGDALISGAITELRQLKVSALYLEVHAQNTAAISLYKKHGFKEVGKRVAYYRQVNGETGDALVLALAL